MMGKTLSRCILPATIVLMSIAMDARANDGAAGLDGGQLVLRPIEGIRMETEDLFISFKEIRVRYEFRNIVDHDIESLVAFPLPAMPAPATPKDRELEDGDWVRNFDYKSRNPLGFSVSVDGRPTAFQTQREFRGKGINRTVALTHFWKQRFPAGKPVVVEHRYRPASSFALTTGEADETARLARDFCVGARTHKGIQKLAPHLMTESRDLPIDWINYILQTARTWSGPIGHFRLVIEKSKPTVFVSVCLDGLKEISPTRYEFVSDNFVPQRDLAILFAGEPRNWPPKGYYK